MPQADTTRFRLGARALAKGYRLLSFESVGSTNTEARGGARDGHGDRVWYVTDNQLAGRGRRGRPWQTPKGNLAASLLLTFDKPDGGIAGLGFVAGVALGEALGQILPPSRFRIGLDGADGQSEAGRARIALKWPNDVLADGAKLAGILLESEAQPGGGQIVVIGFGINVVEAPADVPYPATSLKALGADLDAGAVFMALGESWCTAYADWDKGRGLPAILDRWRNYAAGLGQPVAIATPGGTVRGIFETVDERGQLRLRRPDGEVVTIAAGDVHFGALATSREEIG